MKRLVLIAVLLFAAAAAHAQQVFCPELPTNLNIVVQGMALDGACHDPNPKSCEAKSLIQFWASSVKGFSYSFVSPCESVDWVWGDGTTSHWPPFPGFPGHTYDKAGEYDVKMTLHNQQKGDKVATIHVSVVSTPGKISIFPATQTFKEGSGAARISVFRSHSAGSTTVNYQTIEGTAKDGVRYTGVNGTLSWGPNELEKVISIPILDDETDRGQQSLSLVLSNATGAFSLDANPTYTIRIDDNDRPRIGFTSPSFNVKENDGVATISLTRGGDAAPAVGATVQAQGSLRTVSFAGGEKTKTFTLPLTNDDVYSGNKSQELKITLTSSADIGTPSSALLNIADDDPVPTISIDDVSVTEGNSGLTAATFTISTTARTLPFSVDVATENGTATSENDFLPEARTIPFGLGERSKTFSISVIGDREAEDDETFGVTLRIRTAASGAPSTGRMHATGTIRSDDRGLGPSQRIPKGGTGKLILDLGGAPQTPLEVTLTSSQPTVAAVPVGVHVAVRKVEIPVSALAAGTSTIRAVAGNETFSADVTVFEGFGFTPSSPLAVFVGKNGTVNVRLAPAPPSNVTVALASSDASIAGVQPSFEIPSSGSGSFSVSAGRKGEATITLSAPGVPSATYGVIVVDAGAAPAISRVSPDRGLASGGTPVTISGANFNGDCAVTFGDSSAADVTLVGASTLTARTPAHEPGVVDVAVYCGVFAPVTLENGFTYQAAAPGLAAIAPAFGTTSGGTAVRVQGSDLRLDCGLFFDGIPAHDVTVDAPNSMIATAPAHAAGSVDIGVRCGAESASLPNAYTFSAADEPTASIAAVEPLAAAPGESVSVTGLRFRASDTVFIGGAPAEIETTAPDRHAVRVPELPPGPASVTLMDTNGRSTTTGPIFTVLNAVTPELGSVTPSQAPAGGEVVLTGRGLRRGMLFAIGTTRLAVSDVSFTRAVVRLPEGLAPGTYTIDVLTPALTPTSIGVRIEVIANGVVIGSVLPACGSTVSGTDIVIRGRGFAPGATVTVGGAPATAVNVFDGNTILAVAPAGARGAATVTVTNPKGETGSASDLFRYASPFDPDGACGTRARAVRH